jgi:DnaJ-class molecular chaperone
MEAATSPFRQRFLAAECKYWQSGMIRESEAEKILSVSEADGSAEVISSGCGTGGRRVRYSLKSTCAGWLVNEVEWECGICTGTGTRKDRPCRLCKGKGWVGGNR